MISNALRELNPVRDPRAAVDAARIDADLERILAVSRDVVRSAPIARRHAHGRRLAIIAVAGCLAVALAVGLPFLPWRTAPSALAATPPVLVGELAAGTTGAAASSALEGIASAAAGSASLSSAQLSYSTWDLSTRIQGGEPVRSAVVPLEVSVTRQASGDLRVRSAVGRPVAGAVDDPDLPAVGTVASDARGPATFPEALSSDPQQLRTQLAVGHPIDELGSAELLVALTDLAKEQTPAPAVRAAALRVVAQAPGVRDLGRMLDRAGRSGLGFAVDSDMSGLPTRYVLVIDPRTGRLLASEQVLTTRSGRLEVPVPAVVSYTLFW